MELENELNTYRSNCPVVPSNVTAATTVAGRLDEPSESVDLLQMVPDSTRVALPPALGRPQEINPVSVCGTKPHYSKSRSLDSNSSRRMHFLLLREEENQEVETDSGVHICQGCRDSELYQQTHPHTRQEPYSTRTLPERSGLRDDGSVYFNYLRFANTSSRTSPCTTSSTYEAVSRCAHANRPRISSSRFNNPFSNCCKRKPKQRPNKKVQQEYAVQSSEDTEEVLQPKPPDKAAGKSRDWRRIKRLLLLAGVLLGILVALGGMVVGFLVLSPGTEADSPCNTGYVHCGDDQCVLIRHLCQGHVVNCPDVNKGDLCSTYNSSRLDSTESALSPAQPRPAINVITEMKKPTKDLSGWVHYSKGSTNGSRYMVVNKAMTFYGAQDECRKKGGYLAHINTIREQLFIEEFLKEELLNLDISQDGVGFWLGARRARGSHSGTCMYDQWKWVDPYGRQHGVISGFTAFVPGKPDNYFSPEECLYISYENKEVSSYLKWDDAPCDIHSVGGIKVLCEAANR